MSERVYVALDDDLSHGIDRIIGIYRTEDAARKAAEEEACYMPVIEEHEIAD